MNAVDERQEGKNRQTVLITGASAGIGAALAREFASHGCNLVLSARRKDRLETLAKDISDQYKVRVDIEAGDLADPATPKRLFDALQAKNIVIDILINNAGYSGERSFEKSLLQAQRDFVEVMVTSVVALTHLFVPSMVARGFGRVLNVASLAAFVPGGPGFTLYSASKAFLLRFSESLDHELAESNVRIGALCPGFTYSEFHDVSGTRAAVSRMPAAMWMSAEAVAADGYRQAMTGQTVHIPGRLNRFIALVGRLMPPKMARRLIAKKARQYRNVSGRG